MTKALAVLAMMAWAPCLAHAASAVSFLEAPGPKGPLKGTMLVPAEPKTSAVVLIIPGSGPTDRDGNNPLGIRAATYKLLAEGLAERGITSVRVDKRGMFGSAAAVPDANAVTIADYATDVRSWITVIRGRTGAACVWVLGHSEGGLVALVAARDTPDICGLILVAAVGRPFGQLLREQLKANPANAPILDQALGVISDLEAGRFVDNSTLNPALLPLFRRNVQGFLINEFSYDPAKLIAGYEKPVLILQGLSDIQVSERDAQLLKAADQHAKLALLPGVNHVLKAVSPGDRAANLATYTNASLPLAGGVVDTIAQFILAPPGGR